MFSGLMNFGMKRTKTQALGFYAAYLAILLVLGAIGAAAYALMTGVTDVNDAGIGIGAMVAGVGSAYLAYLVLKGKGLLGRFSSIVYIILALATGIFLGGLIGMIIAAALTTAESARAENQAGA